MQTAPHPDLATANHVVTTYFHGVATGWPFINKPERDGFCLDLERKGWSYKRGNQDHYVFET